MTARTHGCLRRRLQPSCRGLLHAAFGSGARASKFPGRSGCLLADGESPGLPSLRSSGAIHGCQRSTCQWTRRWCQRMIRRVIRCLVWGVEMSIWAVNWALHAEVGDPHRKFVLMALANFADDEDEAFPKVETLAALTELSTRSVYRALAALDDAGFIERRMGLSQGGRGGLRRTNSVYRLLLPETVSRRSGLGGVRPAVVREPVVVSRAVGDAALVESVDESPSGDRCDTGGRTINRCATGGTDRSATAGTTYKEEPSVLTTSTPLPPTGGGDVATDGVGLGLVGDSVDDDPAVVDGGGTVAADLLAAGSEGVTAPVARSGEVIRADWGLCRRVLPEAMQALDDPGVELVAGLLRERIDAGWSMSDLRAALAANPMPDQVRHLAGLVAHRIRQIPAEAAPPQREPVRRREPEGAPRRGVVPEWMRRRAEARAAGDPSGRQPVTWWMERFPAGGSGTAES